MSEAIVAHQRRTVLVDPRYAPLARLQLGGCSQ